jgi:2-amino-4-hydroxy-6-hydroxymethyldihydropteridine diphosphokinase
MGWPGPFVVRVSLADQPGRTAGSRPASLAIALGANLASPAGPPLATLEAVRPFLVDVLGELLVDLRAEVVAPLPAQRCPGLHWSPLFRTAPVGGPPGQPDYLTAVVLVNPALPPSERDALELLAALQALEQRFARQRCERWGPRSLDLDLLWWGELHCRSEALELPHPRLLERAFVLAPLAAIDAQLRPPGARATASDLLTQLRSANGEPAPEQLRGHPGWPE